MYMHGCVPAKVPSTLPVWMLLILAVISSEPVMATVESALMSRDVKPASQDQTHICQQHILFQVRMSLHCPPVSNKSGTGGMLVRTSFECLWCRQAMSRRAMSGQAMLLSTEGKTLPSLLLRFPGSLQSAIT